MIFQENRIDQTEMFPCILRMRSRLHCAGMTIMYQDRHGVIKGRPEREPGAALQGVVSDGEDDAAGVQLLQHGL